MYAYLVRGKWPTLRLLPNRSPETEEDHYAIGRVIVSKEKRGQGYAKELMERAIMFLRDEWKVEQIWLHGQEYLRVFTEHLALEK